eukprot:Tamp_22550.p1 GENE.Tamp_22550~~Tamp_22550.p1  ORF type:complete len:246 (-),score=20.65 Tamp_22550:346-1017(-)
MEWRIDPAEGPLRCCDSERRGSSALADRGERGERAVRGIPARPSSSRTYSSSGRRSHRPAGVGIVFRQDEQDILRVDSVTPGGPAERSGLVKEGDELYSVAGQTVRGLTIGQLARLVLGPQGTTVDLELKRGTQFIKVRIERHSQEGLNYADPHTGYTSTAQGSRVSSSRGGYGDAGGGSGAATPVSFKSAEEDWDHAALPVFAAHMPVKDGLNTPGSFCRYV